MIRMGRIAALMSFNFNTVRIADEEFVSTAQLQQSMAQAAKLVRNRVKQRPT